MDRGDGSKGSCSQAAIFRMTSEAAKKSRKVLELDKEQVDEIMDEERIGYDSAELTYHRAFSFRLDKYDFEDKLHKAVMRSLESRLWTPFLVHHNAPNFYNKSGFENAEK